MSIEGFLFGVCVRIVKTPEGVEICDRFGRPIRNLRVQITTRCNFACIFCHHEGFFHCERGHEGLSVEDVRRIALVARVIGVNSVKVTGGEPLLHPHVREIVENLSELGFEDVSLVTNGSLLEERAESLAEAGLDRVNVSLVSLRPERFAAITRAPEKTHERVIRGIRAAVDAGLNPVKVNVVLLRGLNDDEWQDFIDFARREGVALQFIEFHAPNPDSEEYRRFHAPLDEIESWLAEHAVKVSVRSLHHRRRYTLEDGVEVEVVRPMFNPEFCAHCMRIRATPRGWKPCLLRDEIVEFVGPLRRGDLPALLSLLLKAIELREPYFK